MPGDHHGFQDYLTRHYARLGDHRRHRAGKKRQLLRTYRHLLPPDRNAEILEIGPGYGQLLELLRGDLGYSGTHAVDVSGEVVDFCNALIPASTVLVADTPDYLSRCPGRFDRVFMFHVLEHVPKSEAPDFVGAIRTSLKPGGRLVLEVPNMANLMTGTYLRYADLTHEAGYSETSMAHLLESAGFVEVDCFEERLPMDGPKHVLAGAFRVLAGLAQRLIYKGYELPVPRVLTPSFCATAARPFEAP